MQIMSSPHTYEGMPERSNGPDSRSGSLCLRGFESSFPHFQMKLSRLTKPQKLGIVERWYRNFYEGSAFTADELAPIIHKDAMTTIRTRKGARNGFSLTQILIQQIERERTSDRISLRSTYEEYSQRL